MAKIHLRIAPHPPLSGADATAFCGQVVPQAETLDLAADDSEIEFASTIVFCKTCFGPKYNSFIVAGQEYLDEKFSLSSPRPKPRQTDFPALPEKDSEAV